MLGISDHRIPGSHRIRGEMKFASGTPARLEACLAPAPWGSPAPLQIRTTESVVHTAADENRQDKKNKRADFQVLEGAPLDF